MTQKVKIILLPLLFLLLPISVFAGSLQFDKPAVTAAAGTSFEVGVRVDAGADQISSSDAYILYDSSLLEAATVTPGDFFPTVTHIISPGKIYVAGLVDDPATYKTGSGLMATITFKALTNGTGALSFDCQETASDKSKIVKNDINATNVIVCSQNTSATVTVGPGGSGTIPTSAPLPRTLPQTGILDNVVKYAIPGAILMMIGGIVKIIL